MDFYRKHTRCSIYMKKKQLKKLKKATVNTEYIAKQKNIRNNIMYVQRRTKNKQENE